MSDTGSQHALVPVGPQGLMEVVGQQTLPPYEELLAFYVSTKRREGQTTPPVLSFEELQTFYIARQGQRTAAMVATLEAGQGRPVAYDELLRFYVEATNRPQHLAPPRLSYEELQAYYQH